MNEVRSRLFTQLFHNTCNHNPVGSESLQPVLRLEVGVVGWIDHSSPFVTVSCWKARLYTKQCACTGIRPSVWYAHEDSRDQREIVSCLQVRRFCWASKCKESLACHGKVCGRQRVYPKCRNWQTGLTELKKLLELRKQNTKRQETQPELKLELAAKTGHTRGGNDNDVTENRRKLRTSIDMR